MDYCSQSLTLSFELSSYFSFKDCKEKTVSYICSNYCSVFYHAKGLIYCVSVLGNYFIDFAGKNQFLCGYYDYVGCNCYALIIDNSNSFLIFSYSHTDYLIFYSYSVKILRIESKYQIAVLVYFLEPFSKNHLWQNS